MLYLLSRPKLGDVFFSSNLFFILNNEAIWIQTASIYLRHFSVPIYCKTLDFPTFSAPNDFITLCPSLSQMQNFTFFSPRLTHSFRVKIGVNQSLSSAFRVKMMLSDFTICLSKTLILGGFHPRGHDFSCHFKPLILQDRHYRITPIAADGTGYAGLSIATLLSASSCYCCGYHSGEG